MKKILEITGLIVSINLYATAFSISEPIFKFDSVVNTDKTVLAIDRNSADIYSKKGADTCLICHDKNSNFSVLSIFKTAHGNQNTNRGPFEKGALQCETCHGPVGEHGKVRLRKGEVRKPMIAYRPDDVISNYQKNKICLDCHQQAQLNHWSGSTHQASNMACVDCHIIHTTQDPMSSNASQVNQCGQCHLSQKLAVNRTSTHPLRSGQMGCSDCHRSHDSETEMLLIAETINDTCYQCHAEKRGPFLWEHEPVSESCTNCHLPHGSNHRSMLNQRLPYLCQSCHSSDGHVNFATSSDNLLGGTPSSILLGRSCNNCHSQVHGSNHPSGARFKR